MHLHADTFNVNESGMWLQHTFGARQLCWISCVCNACLPAAFDGSLERPTYTRYAVFAQSRRIEAGTGVHVPSYASMRNLQGQDLASGNLTAPVLFALEHETAGPQLLVSIHRWWVRNVASFVYCMCYGIPQPPGYLEKLLLLSSQPISTKVPARPPPPTPPPPRPSFHGSSVLR